MTPPPSLLFVAPIMPAEGGNGLAMRAGVFLEAFAEDFAVTLLVIPVAGDLHSAPGTLARRAGRLVTLSLDGTLDPLWELCARVRDPGARAAALQAYPRPALCRYATTPCLDAARAAVAGARFDAVHVMRSYLAPYAAPFLPEDPRAGPPFASLDLDDDEAHTHRRLAERLEFQARPDDARIEAAEASKYERHEALWLPRFELRIACTAAHARRTAAAHPGGLSAVVPNTVALPRRQPRWRRGRNRILFVGNLSYFPNVEGIRDFVTATLPRLRARLAGDVVVRIAGSAPSPEVIALAAGPGIELVTDPPDLAPHYRWADLCIVPLAAGGGTRIKLLEAFAHGVPVVASALGAEGVAVRDRTHLLLADSPEAFAQACAELLVDAELAARVAKEARRLVEADYARAVGVRMIRDAFRTALHP